MEEVGNQWGMRWLWRSLQGNFFFLVNYVSIVWGLATIAVMISYLELIDAMCSALYGIFILAGMTGFLYLRVRRMLSGLDKVAKLVIGEVSVVYLLSGWILGMEFWLGFMTLKEFGTVEGPSTQEYGNRTNFALEGNASKYRCWISPPLPNWIWAVGAGIYGFIKRWQVMTEREGIAPVGNNRNLQACRRSFGTSTDDGVDGVPDRRSVGNSMGDNILNNNGSGPLEPETDNDDTATECSQTSVVSRRSQRIRKHKTCGCADCTHK